MMQFPVYSITFVVG